jgi:hypothetical protein
MLTIEVLPGFGRATDDSITAPACRAGVRPRTLPYSEARRAMESSITREEGHAHVAAVRVLRWRLGRPPTLEEIAEVLGSKMEITNHRIRRLAELGALYIVENPFNVHVSVADHRVVDDLPETANEDVLKDAVQDFKKRQAEKAEEMVRTFERDDEGAERRDKHDRIAEDLKRFRPKKAKKAPWEK